MKKRLTLLTICLLVACSKPIDLTVWPEDSWPVASPDEQGLDPEYLEKIGAVFNAGGYGYIDHVMIIRNGYAVMDKKYTQDYDLLNQGQDPVSHQYNYYHTDWHPYYQGSDLHTLQSVTKSITSLLIGIAIQRGDFPELNAKVMDYTEGYQILNMSEQKGQITIEDLLTMRAGLEWDESTCSINDPRNSVYQLEASQDWTQFVLDLPMEHDPGEVFVYSSGAAQLLTAVFKEATGFNIDEYAEHYLFKPLGITEYYWKKTPKGWPDTEGGLYLKTEDLAKIGYLVLQGGVWDGEQLISKKYLDAMISPKVHNTFSDDPSVDWGYGYLWWLMGDLDTELPSIYAALGYGGQYLFVVPELDVLVVFNGWNVYYAHNSVVDLFNSMLPRFQGNLSANGE